MHMVNEPLEYDPSRVEGKYLLCDKFKILILDVLKLGNNIINEKDIGHKTGSILNFFIL